MDRHALQSFHSMTPTSSRVNVGYIGGYYRVHFPKAYRDQSHTVISLTYRPTDIKPLQLHMTTVWE